jgi:intracellular septation protein
MQKQPDAKRKLPQQQAEAGQSPGLKLLIELGPLLVFFGVNAAYGIYAATAAFMVVTLISLAYAFWRYHKLPIMPLVSGAVVLVFGTLTLYLRDDTFIKLKPTLVYLIFAAVLGAGLLLRKPLLELLLFFVAMAVVNELVWRNFSTDVWVSFKAFGFLPITFLFALAQMPLIQRYSEEAPARD